MYGPDLGKVLGCLFAAVVLLALALAVALGCWLGGVQPGWWMAWVGLGVAGGVGLMAVGGWLHSIFDN